MSITKIAIQTIAEYHKIADFAIDTCIDSNYTAVKQTTKNTFVLYC